jgi:drug/metabolite transporter (DMT)-like permease
MLVGLSSGMLAYGMRTVGTGTAAVMVATVPLFATVIAAVAGRKIGRGEWFAVGLGLAGIVILSHGDSTPGSAGGSLAGERMLELHFLPLVAFVYLMLIGTMAAYVAYGYLIRHTSPIIASSCMYVNPVVAVALGALLLGEPVTRSTVLATIVILISVGLSFWFDYRKKGSA